jgi:hypothetical protein
MFDGVTIFVVCHEAQKDFCLLPGTSDLDTNRNLSKTETNTIFQGIKHRISRSEKQKQKLAKRLIWRNPISAHPGHRIWIVLSLSQSSLSAELLKN